MTDPTIALRPADGDDRRYVEERLRENDLPFADVRDGSGRFFVGCRDGDERVAVGGFESYGSVGLLRSVVVERSVRGRGYGAALCRALEAEATNAGLEDLYLLTTTAEPFFAKRGYERIDRREVPRAVRETTLFAERCPETATVMHKRLSS